MEEIIKEHVSKLTDQRDSLVHELSELNENLPNYSVKVMELNNQINTIDIRVFDYLTMLRDFKINELTINKQ